VPGPVVVEPPIVLKKGQGGVHAKPVGWAKDSSELAACAEADGTGALECRFLKPGGKPELVTDFSQDTGVEEGKTRAIKARLAAHAYAVSAIDWPYASQLTLTWKSACDQEKSSCVLRAGATIKDDEAVYPVFVEAKGMLGIHAEVMALSPDAKWLGVIAHSAGGEGSNRFDLRIVAVTTFVGQIYNDAGFAHHKKGQFERSAQLFRQALTADPQNKLAFYNYACALGKQQAPGTEAALKAAIDVGGVAVKKRAAKDTDFALVATADWFVALTR
jgi:tetratricopeptide (TPR) repeat protein